MEDAQSSPEQALENCQEWTEFDSSDENSKILSGNFDMDTYSTRKFPGEAGKLFEGLTLRLFDPKTRLKAAENALADS